VDSNDATLPPSFKRFGECTGSGHFLNARDKFILIHSTIFVLVQRIKNSCRVEMKASTKVQMTTKIAMPLQGVHTVERYVYKFHTDIKID
jgi:hypothetical protein